MFSRPPVWLVLWSLALFTAALLLNTRSNTFPYFYHPDEAEKAAQLITGEWNFHHPMLLLTTAKTAINVAGVPLREQSVVEAGRWVSATFAAVAVVALSLLAFAWRGWTSAICAGLALLWHHQLFELSHYAKEDTALLAGVALAFLAAYVYWQRPTLAWAAALGIATACAISGKYLGVCVLAVALPVLWLAPGARRAGRCAAFAGALLAALVLINLPALTQPEAFRRSFDRELQLAVHGQGGATRSVPHALYWNVFRDNTTPVMWVLLLVFLSARWRHRRNVSLVEWLLIAFPFAYTLALSFSPKSNDRYFLPATGLFTLFAALGVRDGARLLSRWMPMPWAMVLLAVALIGAQLPRWWRYDTAFRHDDNRELFDWAKANLPPDAVIAKDSRVQLPGPKNARVRDHFGVLPQTILADKFAADLGEIRELRKRGVTHVAVSESDYGRFFLRGLRPKKNDEDAFDRRRSFYKKLLRNGRPLFIRDRGTVLYLHPGLRLYTIPPEEE